MPTCTTIPTTATYYPLSDPAELATALAAAIDFGYRGTIVAHEDPLTTQTVWSLELNGPGNPFPVTVTVGDVIVWDGTVVYAMTAEVFTTKYAVSP